MEMFNGKFKLIATMVGLVAVLAMMLAVPGVTQQFELPSPWTPPFNPFNPKTLPDILQENPLTRENLIQVINRIYAPTLTASEGDIWDTQCAGFYSSPFITLTFIPANPHSRSIDRILAGDLDNVPLFMLYVHDDGESKPVVKRQIAAGAYMAKLVSPTKVIFVDQEGNEVLAGEVEIIRSDKPSTSYFPCFPGQAQIGFTLAQNSQNMMPEGLSQTSSDGYIYGQIEYCYAWCFIRVKVTIVIACTVEEGVGQSAHAQHSYNTIYASERLRRWF
jgi:hypothetical protein